MSNIYQFDAEIFNDGWNGNGESYYVGQSRNGNDSIYSFKVTTEEEKRIYKNLTEAVSKEA